MSDQDDWEFAGPDDAKTEIRAAVRYLLRGATGGARGDIVQESQRSCASLGRLGWLIVRTPDIRNRSRPYP